MMYRLQVKANALNKRKRIPPSLPDNDWIAGVVLKDFSFVGERVLPADMPNGATGKWYKDRDGYYYLGEWLMEIEELLTPELAVVAEPRVEIPEAVPEEVIVQTNYNELLQHIPTEWKLTRGKNVKIAVLDSGFILHNDLKNNIVETFNAVNNTTDVKPSGADNANHGNNVAGLIAASTSLINGVKGIAPESQIIAIKVSNNGFIRSEHVLNGLKFAINKIGVRIINLSISIAEAKYKPFQNQFLELFETAKNKGILIVASAGNNDGLLDAEPNLLFPANEEYCLSIGTINEEFMDDNTTPKYHQHLNYIIRNQSLKSCAGSANTYSTINNSSMAAGILSGTVALLLSHDQGISDKQTFVNQLNSQLEKISNSIPLNLSIYKA